MIRHSPGAWQPPGCTGPHPLSRTPVTPSYLRAASGQTRDLVDGDARAHRNWPPAVRTRPICLKCAKANKGRPRESPGRVGRSAREGSGRRLACCRAHTPRHGGVMAQQRV